MPAAATRLRTRRVAIPTCRDPFINSLLMPVGQKAGAPERFWITTWNSVEGCTGALVDETGAFRLYHFREPLRGGFYSVAAEDLDTLWLWGNLAEVTRLCLRTGHYKCLPTGGPHGLVFHGMAYDRDSGKLLAVANTYAGAGPTAISFDTRRCKTACIYEHVATEWCLHGHFANGDGTYTVIAECPGTSMLHWNPQVETLEVACLYKTIDQHEQLATGSHYRLLQAEDGRVYFPHCGWYDPRRRCFEKNGPQPDHEMTWFARYGIFNVGANTIDGNSIIGLWDITTGHVHDVCTCTDTGLQNINLTTTGKLVAVSLYGEFTRRDILTGRLEVSRLLPTQAIQHTDCLRLISSERLLGTPFITQRFWEVNLKTGKGYDCGRAAPGAGEILQTWRINGKIYMAEYGGGRLVEYDPAVHPHFPENPRVVANPPHTNRPIAAADDGRSLYYTCSAPYGKLGSTVTCYDTVTGAYEFIINPIADQRIVSLACDKPNKRLLATTHFDSDCQSCQATSDKCYFAALTTTMLSLLECHEAPSGTSFIEIIGPVRRDRWLCRLRGNFTVGTDLLLELSSEPLQLAPLAQAWLLPPGWDVIRPTTKLGNFVVQIGNRLELWDLSRHRLLEVLYTRGKDRRLMIDEDTIFLLGDRDILILDIG